jgi:Rrf2 family protein
MQVIMKISTKSEYGTLAMLDLAIHYKDSPIHMKDISERQNITFKYLGQLFLLLKNRGLIYGLRGANGGYQLSRAPKSITLLEIFEALEGPISITECTTNQNFCTKSDACVTRGIWKDTRNLIYNFFKGITLQDLVDKHRLSNITPSLIKPTIEDKNASRLSR